MQHRALAHTADNDAMMGLDPKPRGPLEMPAYYKNTKDGQIMCKAHANSNCKSCCEWRVLYPPPKRLFLFMQPHDTAAPPCTSAQSFRYTAPSARH